MATQSENESTVPGESPCALPQSDTGDRGASTSACKPQLQQNGAPGVSRAIGQVERVMATLKNGLVMIKNYETPEWHTALESLQLALNCTVHRTTVYRVLENDHYLVKKVVGHHGRPRKVAHDQLRRAPQPGGSPQAAVSPPADDHQPGPSSDGTSVASQPLTTSHVSPPLDEQQ